MNAVDELNFRLGIGPARPRLPVTLQRSGYTSVRQLGKGSFGSAYLVFHNERKQYYVVKHVNMATMTVRQRKDAHQEISLLQQLDHPNIVRYIEFCEERPHLYIVMEYADGGDIYTHLKNLKSSTWALGGGGAGAGGSGITEAQVISLFVQTTMAVKYMHDRRLLHRDIKSQNVFLTQNHVVKLGDFGISTVLMSTVAMAQTMCGTPCYFSPELCKGKPYNNKSDVWALGVLLYELCTAGRMPFEGTSMNRLMEGICKQEPRRIPSHFSDGLWNLICWMLQKDSRHRPDAGQILRSPVLMRAIPDIAKKLSATDSRHEAAYQKLLSVDSHPLPPIKPCVDLFARDDGKNDARPFNSAEVIAAAAAAAAAAGGGLGVRLDLFRRGIGEYPFFRAREDPVKEWIAARQRGGEGGGVKPEAMPREKSPSADKSVYDPVLMRAKNRDPLRVKTPVKASNNIQNENGHKGCLGANEKSEAAMKGPKGVADPSAALGCVSKPLKPLEHIPPENQREQQPQPPQPQPQPQPQSQSQSQQLPPNPRPKEEKPKVSIGRVSLRELFLRYDETKKRLARGREERDEGNHVPAQSKEPSIQAREIVAPSPPRRALHDGKAQPSPPSPQPLIPAPERPPCQPQPQEQANICNEEVASPTEALPPDDLARVLEEMTNHFESFHGGPPGHEDDVSAPSQSPIKLPLDERPHLVEDAEEFADAMGTTLDMMGIQRCDGNETNARVPLAVVPLPWGGRLAKLGESQLNTNAKNDNVQSDQPQPTPRLNVVEEVNEQSNGAAKGGDYLADHPKEAEAVDADVTFFGGCLCDGVTFAGLASNIYGSFICNCLACSKVSGAMNGVEWLHLPDISFEVLFTAANTDAPALAPGPPRETAAGGGAVAAQALGAKLPSPKNNGSGAPALPPLLAKNAVRLPVVEGQGEEQGAVFIMYFCTQCGSTIGMNHSEIEGTLIAKAALSDESLAILETFQRTVQTEEVNDGQAHRP